MRVGEIGMVEQAGDEVRRAAADGESVAVHQRQDELRIPHIGQIHR